MIESNRAAVCTTHSKPLPLVVAAYACATCCACPTGP